MQWKKKTLLKCFSLPANKCERFFSIKIMQQLPNCGMCLQQWDEEKGTGITWEGWGRSCLRTSALKTLPEKEGLRITNFREIYQFLKLKMVLMLEFHEAKHPVRNRHLCPNLPSSHFFWPWCHHVPCWVISVIAHGIGSVKKKNNLFVSPRLLPSKLPYRPRSACSNIRAELPGG